MAYEITRRVSKQGTFYYANDLFYVPIQFSSIYGSSVQFYDNLGYDNNRLMIYDPYRKSLFVGHADRKRYRLGEYESDGIRYQLGRRKREYIVTFLDKNEVHAFKTPALLDAYLDEFF